MRYRPSPSEKRRHPRFPFPFDIDTRLFAVSAELRNGLDVLAETRVQELRPRDFVERHLVDEMVLSKWRQYRVRFMEKAVYEHRIASFIPAAPTRPDGNLSAPEKFIYHIAAAHSSESDGPVLAALTRLEARYARQFLSALSTFNAHRRANPVFTPRNTPGKEKDSAK